MNLRDIFDRLGLPRHADSVYESLEKNGPAVLARIAKSIHVHRPAVYRAVEALEKQGFISRTTFGGRSYISAAPRSVITQSFADASKKVTRMHADRPLSHSFGTVRYVEGDQAVATVFTDVLEHSKRGDTFYRYTSERDLDAVNAQLPSGYRAKRDAKRLERLVISNPESGTRKRPRLERFVKFLGGEQESFRQNAIQLIYGNRIAFLDLNSGKGCIIENATLADFQRTIFKALYKRLPGR